MVANLVDWWCIRETSKSIFSTIKSKWL